VGRPRLAEPRDRQLLIRLTANEIEILEAAAWVDHQTPNGWALDQLTDRLRIMATDPDVLTTMQIRRSRDTRRSTTTPIETARQDRVRRRTERSDGSDAISKVD